MNWKLMSMLVFLVGFIGCFKPPQSPQHETVIRAGGDAWEADEESDPYVTLPKGLKPNMEDPVPPEMDGIIGFDDDGNPIRVNSSGNPARVIEEPKLVDDQPNLDQGEQEDTNRNDGIGGRTHERNQ